MLRSLLFISLALLAGCHHQKPNNTLAQAARTGDLNQLKLLLDSGADINTPEPTGDGWDATPLQFAILARRPSVVEFLLERGADPNRTTGPNAPAPLILAAGDTDPALVNVLLAHNANPALADNEGVTPLSRAVSAGTLHGPDRPMFGGCRTETVRALLAHEPTLRLKHDSAGKSAIRWARFQRCSDVLKLIGE